MKNCVRTMAKSLLAVAQTVQYRQFCAFVLRYRLPYTALQTLKSKKIHSVWTSSGVRAAAWVLFTRMQKSRPAVAWNILIKLVYDVFMKVVALSLSFLWPWRAPHLDFGWRSYGQNTKVCVESNLPKFQHFDFNFYWTSLLPNVLFNYGLAQLCLTIFNLHYQPSFKLIRPENA